MQGRAIELWIFDRSGPYSSSEFDIYKEPEKLIKAITGYTSISNVELGLNTYIELKDIDRFIDINTNVSAKINRL